MYDLGSQNDSSRKGQIGDILMILFYLNHHNKKWTTCDTSFLYDQVEVCIELNWSGTYCDAVEKIAPDMSDQQFKPVRIITFYDEDHARDLETRWSVTGVLIIINKKPI